MIKRMSVLIFLSIMAMSLMFGCAAPPKPKPLGTNYIENDYEMTVDVVHINDSPAMMDSGNGGLIGLIVKSGRASDMRKKMEGIKGSTVSELVRQAITEKLEDHFEVVDEDAPLATEINVESWGWFVPTTAFGIKTGSYQFRIYGFVSIYDNSNKGKKEKIAYAPAFAQTSLGNDPAKDNSQEALLKTVDEFTNAAVAIILKNNQ